MSRSRVVSLAKGYGCDAARLDDLEAIKVAAMGAWTKAKPTVLEIPISTRFRRSPLEISAALVRD